MSLLERLQALKDGGEIGGYAEPHANQGAAGGMLPWVISAKRESRGSSFFYSDESLEEMVSALERFGAAALDDGKHGVVVER